MGFCKLWARHGKWTQMNVRKGGKGLLKLITEFPRLRDSTPHPHCFEVCKWFCWSRNNLSWNIFIQEKLESSWKLFANWPAMSIISWSTNWPKLAETLFCELVGARDQSFLYLLWRGHLHFFTGKFTDMVLPICMSSPSRNFITFIINILHGLQIVMERKLFYCYHIPSC